MTTPRVPQGAPERAAAPDVAPAVDQWVSVGPAVVIRGEGTGRPRISGRVVALAVNADGQRIYAGTSLGGVWYSSDEGAHWTSLDFYSSARDSANALQHADALTVGSLAVKWGANAAADEVYVGAGEHPPFGPELASSLAAVGIRRAVGPATAVAPIGAAFVGAAAADPWGVEAANLVGVAVNQLAIDPTTDGVVWAATSRGLFRRTPGLPVQWTQIDTGLDGEATAVVVFPGAAAGQQTVYVAVTGGRVARSTDDGTSWQPILLPSFAAGDVVPGTLIGVVRLARGNVPGSTIVYALADGPRLWRIDGAAVRPVRGLPRAISERVPDSPQRLALALAVHPAVDVAHQDVIAIGGLAVLYPTAFRRQAALFIGQVTLAGAEYTFQRAAPVGGAPAGWIGGGLPHGVLALEWVATPAPAPTHLWVGGDGGVFRSTTDGSAGSFAERNTGLGAIEITAFAQSSDVDTVMIAATRTNGLLRRCAGETWEVISHGPIGGVAIDPGNPLRMFAQKVGSAWQYTEDGGALITLTFSMKNPARKAIWDDALNTEDEASAPVSRMAMIVATRSSRGTQRAFGTNRVWYTDEDLQLAAKTPGGAATGWVTLPTGTNPYDPALPNAPLVNQDALDKPVLALEWGTEARLYVLTANSLYLFERNVNLSWKAPEKLYDAAEVQKRQKLKSTPPGQIPYELPRLAFAVHEAGNGKGSCYIGTGGVPDKHHCWWFNGAGQWLDTGFAVDTSVRAIVVDPRHREVVYIATDRGVYRGVGNFPVGANPNWNWSLYGRGLPGAPCLELAIYSPLGATTRLLRVALAGRGIWEVLLDGLQQGSEVYLRAHAYDSRRGQVPVGGIRDPQSAPREQVPLDASPDIRVWRAPGAAPPEAINYAFGPASDAYDIWRLLAGIRAAGDDVDPSQGWVIGTTDATVASRRAIVLAGFPGPLAPTDQDFWRLLLANNPIPHDRTPLDHADLVAYLRDEPDRWPKGFRTSCVSGDGLVRIFVTVHSRDWHRIADNTVKVALLKTRFGRRHSLEGTSPLPANWGADLVADLNLVGPRPLVSPAFLTIQGWEYVDPQNPFRWIIGPFDTHNPQVVTFDASLTGGDTWNKPGWLLLAVVLSNGDHAPPAETNIARLVRTDRRVAARSVRKAEFLKEDVFLSGMDISDYPGDAQMDAAWRLSTFVWTGVYFPSPRPQPALGDAGGGGHHRMWGIVGGPHPAPDPFPRAWAHLFPDWGVALIYWGQQAPVAGAGPFLQVPPPNPTRTHDLAVANAEDAVHQAETERIPKGAAIYLDFEAGGNLAPMPWGPVAVEYCTDFFHQLAEFGYRPALYSPGNTSVRLRQETPWLLAWNVRYPPVPPNAWRMRQNQLVIDSAQPVNNQDVDAFMRQWIQENPGAGVVLPPILDQLGAVVPNPINAAFRPDFNVCFYQDPAFPERRNQPRRIRVGRVVATANTAGQCAIYTVRRGRPVCASGALAALARANLVPANIRFLWNPFSVPAAVRIPGATVADDPTDVVLAIGLSEREGDDVWRVLALRHLARRPPAPAASWELETVPDNGFPIDPLPGLAAITRGDESVDVFAILNSRVEFLDDGDLAVARWDPDTRRWSTLAPIAGAAARRLNRPAAVSRDSGIADVWWVNPAGRLATASATSPANREQWSAAVPISDAAIEIHRFSNITAASRNASRIDVFYIGRQAPAAQWQIYQRWWTNPGDWAPANSRIADNGAVNIEPLASIAACVRDDAHLDVFFVGLNDGALYVISFDYAADIWSVPLRIGGGPIGLARVASVDSACSHGGADVQVIVSTRDGNVWATSWDDAAGAYRPLVSLAADLPL